MADEAGPSKRRAKSRRRRSRRERRQEPPEPSFLQRFWFELLAALFLALGVFLLVERLNIKQILWRWLVAAWEGVLNMGSAASHWIARNVIAVEKSDLVGIALITVALVMIGFRLRGRAIARRPPPPLKEECPKCKADMVRAPRRFSHRLLEYGLWIRIRRYACSKCSFRTVSWHRLREEE